MRNITRREIFWAIVLCGIMISILLFGEMPVEPVE